MMKKMQLIEALRTVKKQKVSFISILVIAFLAVTCFTGVRFAAKGLANGASDFYEKLNYRDFEILSAVLFSDQDLKEIASVEGVKDVESLMQTTAKIVTAEGKTSVSVLSKTERINIPEIVEGQMPATKDACAIE